MLRLPLLVIFLALTASAETQLKFRAQEIQDGFGIGYAVLAEDVDRDGRLDVLAINETTVNWWKNPTLTANDESQAWIRHVVLDGKTEKDNVTFAAHDIDGDGVLDLALGAAWRPSDTEGGGTLQWIGPRIYFKTGHHNPRASQLKLWDEWSIHPIGAEPTLHRIRWGDTDGDGKKELLVAPLHGRGTSGPKHWEGAGARLLVLRPPDWSEEVADDTLHILHNFWVTNFDGDPAEEILTASYEGVHLLDRSASGKWTRTKLGEGYASDEIRGAGEIKLGRLKNGKRYIATVEPWHANQIVVYEEPANPRSMWTRRVVADKLNGGHALWTADMDGDGDEELVVGWRLKGEGDFAEPGVAVFDPGDWKHQMIDSGGMATEDLTVADFNADGKPDIVAVGRATHNVKIYWQE